jgi:hypothetical protein
MDKLLSALMLTVFAVAAVVADVVVDQPYDGSSAERTSQELPDYPEFSTYQLDDFATDQDWLLSTLTVLGTDGGWPPDNYDVVAEIWDDLPEDPNCGTDGQLILSAQGSEDEFTFGLTFDFGDALLPAGSYWLSVYVVRDFGAHGFWKWYSTTPVNGSEAYYHNPGGGHGYGICPIPGSARYGEVRDMAFTLEGTPAGGCAGDLDGDGDTDQSDLGILLANWGCDDPVNGCAGDLDGDDDTDESDLGILLADWGCVP